MLTYCKYYFACCVFTIYHVWLFVVVLNVSNNFDGKQQANKCWVKTGIFSALNQAVFLYQGSCLSPFVRVPPLGEKQHCITHEFRYAGLQKCVKMKVNI